MKNKNKKKDHYTWFLEALLVCKRMAGLKTEDNFWTKSRNFGHGLPSRDSSAIAGHRNEVSKNFFRRLSLDVIESPSSYIEGHWEGGWGADPED